MGPSFITDPVMVMPVSLPVVQVALELLVFLVLQAVLHEAWGVAALLLFQPTDDIHLI